jgi:hypothetical protein
MNGRKKPEPDRTKSVAFRRGRYYRGLGSAAVGYTLVGYILGSLAIGYFLDAHFGTSFWKPLFVIIGAVAGFRDMIQTLNRVSRQEKADRDEARASAIVEPKSNRSISSAGVIRSELTEEENDRPKPRIFAVPPPPQASFDAQRAEPSGAELEQSSGESDSTTDLIEKLMSDDQTSSP